MPAICIATIVHGSRLFGTDDESSDVDLKSVWLPSGRDILLGRLDWSVFNSDSSRRNSSGDTDHERHDLARFLKLVAAGNPTAVEMLFAPNESFVSEPHEIWHKACALAPYIITSDTSRFMGFLEQQAPGFGIGGERLDAVRRALGVLDAATALRPRMTVGDVAGDVVEAAASRHVRLDTREDGSRLLMLAGRSMPFENKASAAQKMARGFIASFEARADRLAAGDRRAWKAVAHAIRIAEEALELLTTGRITLPRPNADYLLGIGRGEIDVREVATWIDRLPVVVREAQASSVLQDKPDLLAIDEMLVESHARQVSTDFVGDPRLMLS
jgi:Predicted nucleotidyltransferase.